MPRVDVGKVAKTELRYGPRPTSVLYRCPACRSFVSSPTAQCARCGTAFEQVATGYSQVVESAP